MSIFFLYFQKSTLKEIFKLELLPPTDGAAKQHAMRVFYQIQLWLGNELNAEQWGWIVKSNGLQPKYSEDAMIPDELLKTIISRYETGCKKKNL